MFDLTVITVYWEGDFRKRTYTKQWVARTKRMVERALPGARFICLTNVEIPEVTCIPLKHNWPGWWAKVELFRPDLLVQGRLLYIDLDTLLVGDLHELVNSEGSILFSPPSYTFGRGTPSGKSDVVYVYNSSVILWDYGQGFSFYNCFEEGIMNRLRGDQDWFGYHNPYCKTLPGKFFKKLRDCPAGPPEECRIVFCMPWKNDKAVNMFPWVKEIW